jgi:hypothetical protein
MLTRGFSIDGVDPAKKAIMDAKLSGYGFLAGIQQAKNQKKRKFDQISQTGRFTYKYKEGHSKNFKRELTFDYFLF